MDIKKILAWVIPVLILVSIYYHFSSGDTGAGRPPGRFATPVTVATVVKDKILNEVEAVGTASANESVELSANVTETIEKINFIEGIRVKKGDILVELSADSERAAVDEAQKQYDRIKTLTQTSAATITRLDQQILALDQAKAALNDRILTAPFSGIVGIRQVSEGALVTPGQVVTTIDDLSQIKLDFSIPEKYLGQVAIGQPVRATSIAYPGVVFEGRIYALGTRVDPATRAFQLRALIPNDQFKLRPGMLLNVLLELGKRSALVIPEEAINYSEEEKYVFVVVDGKTEKREVKLGERFAGSVEVLSGVKEGEQVIVEGGLRFQGGDPVNVVGTKTIEDSLNEYLQYHE